MKVGNTLYTDKKEAGTALVEMCKEIKSVNAPTVIGEYAGFKMAVSFDSFNHKFVMNVKGQLSHNTELGSDALGNIARINHMLESMPKQLAESQTKLETMEKQLETAKIEVEKPFAQEPEQDVAGQSRGTESRECVADKPEKAKEKEEVR